MLPATGGTSKGSSNWEKKSSGGWFCFEGWFDLELAEVDFLRGGRFFELGVALVVLVVFFEVVAFFAVVDFFWELGTD